MVVHQGFTDTEYIAINKLVGFWALVIGSLVAGALITFVLTQFAGDIRLMPKGIRQARRPPDLPIQHGGALVVMPRRLQVPDVTLCLSQTAKRLGKRRPVSFF